MDDATAETTAGQLAGALDQFELPAPAPGGGCGSTRVDDSLETFRTWVEIRARVHTAAVRDLLTGMDRLVASWTQIDSSLRSDAAGVHGG